MMKIVVVDKVKKNPHHQHRPLLRSSVSSFSWLLEKVGSRIRTRHLRLVRRDLSVSSPVSKGRSSLFRRDVPVVASNRWSDDPGRRRKGRNDQSSPTSHDDNPVQYRRGGRICWNFHNSLRCEPASCSCFVVVVVVVAKTGSVDVPNFWTVDCCCFLLVFLKWCGMRIGDHHSRNSTSIIKGCSLFWCVSCLACVWLCSLSLSLLLL
mmetsp:Transcript_2502/g.2891  ORF Transcript_2502/g.2891 Transcript_2502/m.2891 type:complete len:207 (-) Transcript_2502:710-1330(-)